MSGSRIFGGRTETRAIESVPWNVGGPNRKHVSQERALGLTAVFAANRHVTDFCSTLPLKAYRRISDNERAPTVLPRLFNDLRLEGRLVPWLGQGFTSLVLRGNAVGLKVGMDGFGFPAQVVWLNMDKVSVDDSSGAPQWYVDGKKVSRLDIVHVPWITIPGRTLGLSPIECYASTVNAGLSAQSFGNDWFAGGGYPPSVFRNMEKVLPEGAAERIRSKLTASIRRHEPLVTGKDWEYTPVNIPPEQAQFIETQKLTANQVAAIYGIAPDEIGGEAANSLTYSTEETRQIRRASDLRPYLTRFEECFASLLPARQFVRFNIDATIRVDMKTRHEIYAIQAAIGLTTGNERRTKEELPPLKGGDTAVPLPVQQKPPGASRYLAAVPDEGKENSL